ncbi:iron complex transport system ATP-binding protein [Clostridium tetanomorphum]|uniref:ABC transporter ATP-binding protein n=1 Tax=Clostridium tetanomorphum TaxID=1553 RepID=A0A923EDE0_CLOTT|nr:ABC transporter ATP-binding protein [Clostridium tetanomorphum]KAJ51705.1 iron ABC transporter ATPase [Clostridium tetanomorphum DSM 665]MBC2399119.1 ABC transporter ATP-binding protein [Clostridium tetanomorphum]MBP1865929.1 iron complex transport system ATP-binding protein [Clostridium tetanomorphum]NRS86110.1 iron complex transport system ATP-binding protein [Clostridium tetanomorphum]NRZ95869.1 iron complex transport system ATP-binding protein [Clostridium tetanomorphum]
MILSVEGISFKYSSHSVLKNINFSLETGECLAILGINGAGKSTLLKCVNRILKPQKGVALIGNEDINTFSSTDLAKRIAYVAQSNHSSRNTVFDTIMLGRKPYIKWDISKKDLEIVDNIINMLNLEKYSLKYIDELSGGELQKVIIARALAQEPKILMLDEPTSSLDLKNQLEVIRIIKRIVRTKGMMALVTMHDLNLALRFADKFMFLKNGEIFAVGGIEVMTSKNIESVYSVSVKVEKFKDTLVVIPL